MDKQISDQLTTLGHPHRLALFRLLMRRYPDRLPAGEIALALGLKASTLSAYLASLLQVGLVSQERAGTQRLYQIDMESVRQVFDYLLFDCCRGRPEICAPASREEVRAPLDSGRKYNVLFICTGNSARSIFAESLLRKQAGDRFNAYSAGTQASSQLNPFALDLLKMKGHDIAPLRAKNIAEFSQGDAPNFDFVFTVCDNAANEECPAWKGQPISGHWGVPDPVKVQGTQAEKAIAFQQAYGGLKRRIEAFTALPIASLERIALQSAIDDIARQTQESKQ
jgi:arsenate reductase